MQLIWLDMLVLELVALRKLPHSLSTDCVAQDFRLLSVLHRYNAVLKRFYIRLEGNLSAQEITIFHFQLHTTLFHLKFKVIVST